MTRLAAECLEIYCISPGDCFGFHSQNVCAWDVFTVQIRHAEIIEWTSSLSDKDSHTCFSVPKRGPSNRLRMRTLSDRNKICSMRNVSVLTQLDNLACRYERISKF